MKAPKQFDPYDMDLKVKLHKKADAKNVLRESRGYLSLRCGAKHKSKPDAVCLAYAGMGTQHPGHGRCKFCGGNNTGPRSPEAKAKVSQNNRKHGFYSKALAGDERATYEELVAAQSVTMTEEIFMMKAKILTYIRKQQDRIDEGGENAARVYEKNNDGATTGSFIASTAEDKRLTHALDTLRRMIEAHARLNDTNSEDLLGKVNDELKAATQGKVSMKWKAKPAQSRDGNGSKKAKKK